MKNVATRALALIPAGSLALVTAPAMAQTATAAETGVTNGFARVQAIVDLAVPLMIGIAALVVAATWGMKMLRKA